MAVSRRKFIGTALAGSALAAVSTTELVTALGGTAFGASPAGDVVGKITVGYQGWFACIGDGAPINGWWHWSNDWSQPPSPSNNETIKGWPDMSDYTNGYATAYGNLNGGGAAKLFSSYDQSTVNAHFASMQANNIDTAALQRFNPNSSEGPTRDAMATKVRTAAEAYGRKFYIMYDVSGWTNMSTEMPTDWTSKMSALTASPMYARQNGKPVVGIWGFGFNDTNHPWDDPTCLAAVNWFKSQGCYVMGGVPTYWRTGVNDSRSGYLDTYHAFNMISPWMVGRIGTSGDSDSFYTNVNVGDQADCNANGIDYQPCVLPGDLSGRQRVHGDFMWHQFYNMVRVGAQGIYISMFDEFNEGNQITKTAATQAGVPSGSGLLSLDEDGTACSSDYYLRLTGDGGRMLKGQIALTATRPTQPVVSGGGDTTPPTAPSNLTASSITSSSVALAWTGSTDNVGVTGYQIRSGGAVLSTTGGTSATVSGLNPSTAYTFTVTAVDAAGNVSGASNAVSITTSASPGTNLALNKTTSESGHNQTYASGNAVDGNTGTYWESVNSAFPQWLQVDLGAASAINQVVGFLPPSWGLRHQTIAVATSNDGANFTTIVGATSYTFDPNSTNKVTINFTSTTQRYVRLTFTANDGWPAGQLSEFQVFGTAGSPPPPDTTPPTAPGNLTSSAITSSSVTLSWTASTDNVGVTGYQVRQAGSVVSTVTGTSTTISGLAASTTYSYTVTAIDAAGNVSAASNTVSVTTSAAPASNLAAGKATSESGHTQTYASSNAVDSDANTYWESVDNAFPQWIQVDLGSATSISRLVLKLPPSTSWGARTQTLSVQGSTDNSNFTTLVNSAGYTFDPNNGGNTVTITFTKSTQRYVRLNFTANTGWPAGQLSDFQVWAS